MYIPPGPHQREASARGYDWEVPPMRTSRYRTSHRQYSPREYSPPSHQSRYGPPTDPYSDYAYDSRPPRNSYPYNPYHRDYHRNYPREPPRYSPQFYNPVPPAPQVVYLRDPPDSSRRAKKIEKPGRKIRKRKSNELLNSISQLIKKAKTDPIPAWRFEHSGPSGTNPGPPLGLLLLRVAILDPQDLK